MTRLQASSIVAAALALSVAAPTHLGAQTAGQMRTPVPSSNGSTDRARRPAAEPSIEAVDVEGAERTRPGVVLDAVGLRPHSLLTRDAFARAARKLEALPAASRTELTQRPATNGSVRVKAAIEERALVPKGLGDWAVVGGRAIFVGDMTIDVAGPFGAGEVFSSTFRWAENRPRVGFELAVPDLGPLPGVTRFEVAWDRQAYALVPTAADPFRETRVRAGVGFGDWVTSWLAWHAGTAFDRFDGLSHVSFDGGVDVRLMSDLMAVTLGVETWMPTSGGSRFSAAELAAAWRSSRDAVPLWSATAGTTIATDAAPMALWPGASAGRGRGILLRAHPLHSHGIVTSEVFGRRIAFLSLERQHVVKTLSLATIGVAGFVDGAKAWGRAGDVTTSPFHVDIGGGLRVNAPKTGGVVRLDLGYGLRDGDVKLSAGWMSSWPGR